MFAALAAEQPLRILALADPSPGVVSLAVPYRGAEIAPWRAGTKTAALVRAMLSFLRAQRLPYLPMQAALAGRSALNLEYPRLARWDCSAGHNNKSTGLCRGRDP